MSKYKISNEAKQDLIRIHRYGMLQYGEEQADKYYNSFFDKFHLISERPYAYESAEYIKEGYRKCVCGVDTIFYRVQKNMVEIMTIVGRQNRSSR